MAVGTTREWPMMGTRRFRKLEEQRAITLSSTIIARDEGGGVTRVANVYCRAYCFQGNLR